MGNIVLILAVLLFPWCLAVCTLLGLKRSLERIGRPNTRSSARPPIVVVLIPSYNVVNKIKDVLRLCLADELATLVVVVDGGSTDATVDVALAVAANADGRVVVEEAGAGITGRANCMNLAACIAVEHLQKEQAHYGASTDIDPDTTFFFLHGDTMPPANFAELIANTLEDRNVAIGAFGIYTAGLRDGDALFGYLSALFANTLNNLRSRWMQTPYGDQGLFCRWSVFAAVGGFSKPLMEDSDFVWKARALGTVSIAPACCSTYAGQWNALGIVYMMRNYLLLVVWVLGVVSPESIHRLYYPHRALPPALSYADLSKARQ